MPTGYTQPLYEGKELTFEQFTLNCARAFGALIEMRDEPSDAPIPDSFQPAPFYQQKLTELENNLHRYTTMSNREADILAEAEYQQTQKQALDAIRNKEVMKVRYEAMLQHVKTWQPPSKEHKGLKEFMFKQLQESIQWDCEGNYYENLLAQPKLQGTDWLKEKITLTNKDLSYYRNAHAEEIERVISRNLWVSQLRNSLKNEV